MTQQIQELGCYGALTTILSATDLMITETGILNFVRLELLLVLLGLVVV